jgi:hypothetical protein
MPDNSKSDHFQIDEDTLRNFTLLALPWLSFQRQMLGIVKNGIEKASHAKPIENFTLSELQALMMILDRSGTLRNRIDPDFEKTVESACKEILPKLASASSQLIEAQEMILAGVFEALDKLRKGGSKGRSGRKTAD